jgi:mono/diheme cytochrome c family protein
MRSSTTTLGILATLACANVCLAATKDATAEQPTFYRDVLPILQDNCQTCHRPDGANLGGMVAPMSLMDYQETRPWAKAIARQAEARAMPPWHASPAQEGIFHNQRTLAPQQISTLVRWAATGAPAGNSTDAPPALDWPPTVDGWITGAPDLAISIGEPYLVADEVEDIYVNFVTEITPEMLPEPRWVKSIEFQPGSSVVHHIVAPPLGGLGPGLQPYVYPEGYGTLLAPGDKVRWSMHYHKEAGPGTEVWDQSRANIQFYPEGHVPDHPIVWVPASKYDFVLPPGDANVVHTKRLPIERDALLLALNPHMHLRGKAAKYVAHYPDGRSEVLLDVPRYDFNWQTTYEYPPGEPKQIPAGTEIEFIATWDNSADNPYNPDPTEEVRWGEPTTAEMMVGWVIFADAEPGVTPPGGVLTSRRRVGDVETAGR